MSIRELVYPRLIRLFYANLQHPVDDNGIIDRTRLVTLLNGRTISFSKEDLVGIFGFPTHNMTKVPSNFGNLLGFNRVTALQLLLKKRFVRHIIDAKIIPPYGSRASVNQLDVF